MFGGVENTTARYKTFSLPANDLINIMLVFVCLQAQRQSSIDLFTLFSEFIILMDEK